MVSYDIWFNLKNSSNDLAFCEALDRYLDLLVDGGHAARYRLRRRMLGLGPHEFGEFNVTIEFESLAQLDSAFQMAARRGPEIEPLHAAVYSQACDLRFGLSRDFPDPVRQLNHDG